MAKVCVVHSAVLFFKGCGFFLFLRRDHLMTGVDCHAHAEQRAASEILVSLHQFPTACVEASYHTGKCSERPVFMCFHFVCPPYLLSIF